MKKPLSGQYKFNPDTGEAGACPEHSRRVVGSKATERPSLEEQASLLEWAEDTKKLEQWERDAKGKD